MATHFNIRGLIWVASSRAALAAAMTANGQDLWPLVWTSAPLVRLRNRRTSLPAYHHAAAEPTLRRRAEKPRTAIRSRNA
jgi:hypothetical protein